MPETPDSNLESLLECLDRWDDDGQRDQFEAWLESHPDTRAPFAEQRTIHLALRARVARDASHQIVREAILAAVREEAAPQAVKRSIMTAVVAETRGRSFIERLRDILGARVWVLGSAVAAIVIICGLLLMDRRSSSVSGSPVIAHVEAYSGIVELQSQQQGIPVTKQMSCRAGDEIRVGSNGAVSLVLSNRVRLHVGPNSVLRIVGVADSLVLEHGLLKVSMPGEPADAVWLDTPHLKIIAEQGELAVQSDPDRTRVEVVAGKARVGRIGRFGSIDESAGQMVEVRSDAPSTALAAVPFRRNVWDWPFSVNSPWNTSIGSQALYARINAPGWPPGNLTNTLLARTIFVSGGTNARTYFISPGETPRRIRFPEWWRPQSKPGEIICALFPEDNLCCEMTEPIRLPSLDVQARERNSTDVLGHGVGWSWPRPRIIAGSALGGLIRRGELTFGIRHALALAVHPRYINADNGYDGHRWPGVPVAAELIEQFGDQGNLALGSLVAIPPSVDLSTLGFGSSGPAFEIARALQDYGGYIIQTTDAEFKVIASADAGLPPDLDQIVNALIPHLRLISNNSTRNVGGGGERRRAPAPPLVQAATAPP